MVRRLPDAVLEILEDGEPHDVREIVERMKLTQRELDEIIEFLVGFGFVGKSGRFVQIESEVQSLSRTS